MTGGDDRGVTALHLRGRLLPAGEPVELWVDGAVLSTTPVPGARTLVDDGRSFLLPGLVDAHCHVGIGPRGPVSLDEAADQARTDRDAGTLLIRDCGTPLDTRPLQARDDLPRIIRAGRHIARPKRYLPTLGIELESEEQLVATVREQAGYGDGWVKLVGDWIDRDAGDLRPLWSDRALADAVRAAHQLGARVTAHVFCADAIPGLLAAGIDCLEHATGLTDEAIGLMAEHGVGLVPTLINIDNFPGIADRAAKYPAYAKHMRALHAGAAERIGAAIEAGVPVYAGTDAGGGIEHGRIVDEIIALHRVGMSRTEAIGAASWRTRQWLGLPSPAGGQLAGAPADLLVYQQDPSANLSILRRPNHILLRGKLVR